MRQCVGVTTMTYDLFCDSIPLSRHSTDSEWTSPCPASNVEKASHLSKQHTSFIFTVLHLKITTSVHIYDLY